MEPDDKKGCGLSHIYMDADANEFSGACDAHDFYWEEMYAGRSNADVDEIDRAFLQMMLAKANTPYLRVKAYIYYGLAHLYGLAKWKNHEK